MVRQAMGKQGKRSGWRRVVSREIRSAVFVKACRGKEVSHTVVCKAEGMADAKALCLV